MPTLYVLRHAKSDWNQGLPDIERPLAPRGRKSIPAMGLLTHVLPNPLDLIITSPAERARSTADGIRKELTQRGESIALRVEGSIYDADVAQLMSVIHGIDPRMRTAMLVGHNPGFEDLVATLCTSGGVGRVRMPTAALAHIEFHQPGWDSIHAGSGQLEGLYLARVMRRFFKTSKKRGS